MFNKENPFTRITLEQSDRKIVWEVPFEDVDGNDMMQAINTIMIGMTFYQDTVYSSMVNYLLENASDKYYITECDNEDKKEDE